MLAPNSWLRDYGPGYRHLSRSERRAVSDFVMLWSVYEAQVLACNATAQRMMDAVERWHANGLIETDARADESWSHFVERLRNGKELSHRFDGLRLSNQVAREFVENAVLAEPAPHRLVRHKALALIIHRIRNNLLHGEKWSYGLQDQELNFRHSSHVLMLWMDMHRSQPLDLVRG
ncbi:hypothetical protein IFR23_17295 [Sphingomonas sp. CFBP 13603]|uniref:hypothetical protein n=1 Tax=Sphingomonas sp. CFBP 13603 TaxID=2774040 RepID=UPI001869368D|nr:hypothetical protein [Sphingomonas sp. CFBP 13603]MBE2993756.1 hypothetical protein [Sphingomonas sp. CFBP 13603]